MQSIKILVADDESRMRKLIHDFLMKEGYEVLEAEDGDQALDLFYQEREIALVILDVMMPGTDGWTVLKEIRKESSVPVIMLTAKSEEEDELMGFDLGADEYVKKPFSIKALGARVRAIIQRTNPSAALERLEEGSIVLDKSAHEVRIDGKPVDLSFKEFELLQYFMENKGIALSREKILNNVWNYDYYGDARTIDTHVKKLRAKMGEAGSMIQTVWGYGYKFEA
ncbi:MAG: response regulator transcription factor [Lachnospiraceae bacterium]|nr:response regulator transcription factor [Lachnospiraceae bacterium]MBQ9644144.1 response regulator transcription factor [Lachnospiraceae bacterium]